MNDDEDILISGLGVVSPIGIGVDAFWNSLIEGRSGVTVRPEFADSNLPFRLVSQVGDFDPRQYVKPRKALKVMCPPIQLGCAAANLAIDHAQLDTNSIDPERFATVFGTEIFLADPGELRDAFAKCVTHGKYHHNRWGSEGIKQIEPLWMLKYLPNMVASHISIALDARGPSNSICQGDASSLLSIIEAAELLRRKWADIAVAGGTGSNTQLTVMLYRGASHLSRRVDDPQRASRPFDWQRDGSVVGEGAGSIVLESAEHLKRRGGKAVARLAGWARGFCPTSGSEFPQRLEEVAREAIFRAGLTTNQIGQINAHGLGTIFDDRNEAAALARLNSAAPMLALKHNFGNLGPGGGCIELVGGILAMQAGMIPAAINFERAENGVLVNLVPFNRQIPHNHLLKLSVSSTGQIAALVVSAHD